MTVLCIETSTSVCSAAICKDGKPVKQCICRDGSNHARLLPRYIEELLSFAREQSLSVEAVVLSEGPGSYTGLRIGTSTAKGLCYGLDVPLIPVPTLDVLCEAFRNTDRFAGSVQPTDRLCPMIDARRMEVYTSDTNGKARAVVVESDESLLPSGESGLAISDCYYFGDGAAKCRTVLSKPNWHYIPDIVPEAQYMGALIADRPQLTANEIAYYEPYYLKEFVAAPSHVKGLKVVAMIGLILSGLLFFSCSTQKNTWATRSFHQTKVKYNILYNGNVAYEEGLKAIRDANTDDYTHVLHLYPVSNHAAAEAGKSQMDRTIDKCRKCIKLHSIKAKPKRDPKKAGDPNYKLWLQSEEFNQNMDDAWLRLGQAEFHKGDFLGAVSTFNYIINHYQNDPDMVAQCQLWIARAYAEMGWQYEAEDMLNRVQIDALSRKHARLYSAVKADVLLHGEHYHEAIPFVKIAMPYEKRKIYRPRFAYVLGQLYEKDNNSAEAIQSYKYVIRMAPPNEMDFNARIRMAELGGRNSLRKLRTMSKQTKYKDRLDQIFGTMGNIYLTQKDTAKALEMYEKAIAEATQAGTAKAAVLVRAGDLYFEQRAYVNAQPCYREAVTILTAESEEYARVQKRSEVLDELIVSYTQAQLQDSLQRLGQMTEEEQRAIVDKIIADLIEAEKQDSTKQADEARAIARGDDGPRSVNTANMLGGGGAQKGEWYFYNPQLVKQGQQEWRRKWGNRVLEDNWRRQNKQVMMSDDMSAPLNDENDSTMLATDSATTVRQTLETDVHKPEYYLQQIPRTAQDYALSDSLWREAMVDLYYIYRDKLEDEAQAQETLRQLDERFGTHPSVLAIHEDENMRALRHDEAYIARMRRMMEEQDSLYAVTYKAYTKGEYATVKANKRYAQTEFPQSRLMPRFLFLNAVSVARTEGQEAFVAELQGLVEQYGTTELGTMAKDMLAMLGQGMESQKGGATSSLADMRGQVDTGDDKDDKAAEQQWSEDRKQPSVAVLIMPTADEEALNELLYEVALFNFSQFLIRDFDLQKMPVWGSGCALRVSGFADMDEAEWWIGLIQKNADMQSVLQNIQIKAVTEVNLPLIVGKT